MTYILSRCRSRTICSTKGDHVANFLKKDDYDSGGREYSHSGDARIRQNNTDPG